LEFESQYLIDGPYWNLGCVLFLIFGYYIISDILKNVLLNFYRKEREQEVCNISTQYKLLGIRI
jgi:hypothetical protein